jgi:hypothetical protein
MSACTPDRDRPFNLGDQSAPGWWRRAELCADMIARLDFDPAGPLRVADLGCGDAKLEEVLRTRRLPLVYQGFDLLPQRHDVLQIDLNVDRVPEGFDIAVLLGVGEYLLRLQDVLRDAAGRYRWVVFSHVVKSNPPIAADRLAALGWVNHMDAAELVGMIEESGLRIVERRMTPDRRTLIVACRGLASGLSSRHTADFTSS